MLVYNDAFHPGWTAFVDEAARPILRANYLFKGVALDAGRHRVTFAYRPPGLRFGVWMSGIGMAFAVGMNGTDRRREALPSARPSGHRGGVVRRPAGSRRRRSASRAGPDSDLADLPGAVRAHRLSRRAA